MYGRLPSFILGFHGCDRAVAAAVISGRTTLAASRNRYDWLGEGIYFWEHNPTRALDFVTRLKGRKRAGKTVIKQPAVIGAVIGRGNCLNLLDAKHLSILREGHEALAETMRDTGRTMPVNQPLRTGGELLLRDLDCAVINTVHASRAARNLPAYDTVRSAFIEGDELYPGSTFREKNHIQICVRNPACIKGYFRPMPGDDPTSAGVPA